MRPHRSLFIPWLATVTQAIDTCGYLVTDPLAANLLHARNACSSFQQSTTSLCPTTATVTRVVTITTPATTVQTLTVTNNATVTTTVVTSVIPSAVLVTTTRTTSIAQPSGPIAGSLDKRGAEAIQCPRLYGPEVPGPFAFFCQAPAFGSACRKVGISATIQTIQSKATTTTNRTTTVADIITIATSVTTTATLNTTATATTRLATPTSTIVITETNVPRLSYFALNYRGIVSGRVGGTYTQNAGDPITLSNYKTYNGGFFFTISETQSLLGGPGYQFPVFVSQGNNSGVIDYVVRYSGYLDGRDPVVLRCELSTPPTGVLSCISGVAGRTTTLFQTCNNDGQLYHGPGLLPGCTSLQLSRA